MAELSIEQALQLGLEHQFAGRLDEAEAIYRQILVHDPRHVRVLHALGVLAQQRGQHQAALQLIDQAIAIDPNVAEFHCHRGIVLNSLGQTDQAIESFQSALRLNAVYVDAHFHLAGAMLARRQFDGAIAGFEQVIRLRPDHVAAHKALALALWQQGRAAEAVEAGRRALQLDPRDALAHHNVGYALQHLGRLDEAIESYQSAMKLGANRFAVLNNIANVLREQARLDEAIDLYRQAAELQPAESSAHSNLVYTLHFHPGYDAKAIAEEHRRWNQKHAEPLKRLIKPHANDRDPERRLKIGYVSPNFCEHVVGHNLLPLFRHHDHSQFEIVCYSSGRISDELTDQFRAFADQWHDVIDWSDQRLADRIREDRIDVLVDLALHLEGNRLLVFAQKPAPVQMTFAGYPGSTGLDAIDYRLTDPYLDSPGEGGGFSSEEPLRLPDTFWCYEPSNDEPVTALSAVRSGFVTFGSTNHFCKVNDTVLKLWANILRAVPNSQLLILCQNGSHRQHVLNTLGVEPGRVRFVEKRARPEYLKLYHEIDIALDTFPYNGHTTSLDAMWMGVPTISLIGQTIVGRAGLSQLSNIGLTELVARSPEEYVRIATNLAGDLPRLQELRATLRRRMQESALMDGPRFARGIEDAYRMAWRRWCMNGR